MPKYVVNRVKVDNGGSLKGKKVQVIGVAYKPNVADTRETPAELVINELESEGALVSWHDPVVKNWQEQTSTALGGSDIAIVITHHNVIDFDSILKSAPYVFDTTGKISGAKGF